MFAELGLNVARQPDNAANPRPDNRSGWMEGETPDVIDGARSDRDAAPARAGGDRTIRLWDPSTQLRFRAKRSVPPRPDGAPNRVPALDDEGARTAMSEIEAAPRAARAARASGAGCGWSAARRAPRCCSTGGRCCCCAPTTTSGSPIIPACARRPPTRRCAGASGAGASRLVSGTMTIHRRLEERLADSRAARRALLFGSGYLANIGVLGALAGRGRRDLLGRAQPRVDRRRLPPLARRGAWCTATATWNTWPGASASTAAARRLIVTDSVFSMDGDMAPLAEIAELAAEYRRAHGRRRGARAPASSGPGGRGAVAEAGLEGEVDVVVGTLGKALGSYGAYACASEEMVRYLINTSRSLIFSTAPVAAGRGGRAGRAGAAPRPAAPRAAAALQRPRAAPRAGRRGLPGARSRRCRSCR